MVHISKLPVLDVVLEKDGDQLDRSREKEVLHGVKEERNILHTMKISKVNWIRQILRGNCLLKHDIEGETEERIAVRRRG